MHVYSGSTEVTVYGSHFDSVAEPRITLTVVITRDISDTDSASSNNETDSGVSNTLHFVVCITLY